MTLTLSITVIVAGGLAAVIRYLVSVRFSTGSIFPWAVLTVNGVGSTLGGIVLGLGAGLASDVQLVLLAGVAGGLTTFSTVSVETVQLVLARRERVAVLNVAANLAVGLAVTAMAYAVTSALS